MGPEELQQTSEMVSAGVGLNAMLPEGGEDRTRRKFVTLVTNYNLNRVVQAPATFQKKVE